MSCDTAILKKPGMIDRQTIERIFSAADIVEVISEFVSLKKSGQNFKGLSPFKNEKTPSFFVSPAKGIFKCFSSGIGGNVVNFLMEHEKLTYPEALRYLARKYNIEIVEKEETPEEQQIKNERESLLALNEFAGRHFSSLLKTEEGKAIGKSYFLERGLRDASIEKFQLGYAREDKTAFTKAALDKGFKLEYLVKSGLTIQKDNDYRVDRFHGRVIFPIHGLSGQIIGFAGRILKTDDKTSKYINSPESEIYHKSQVLYGLFFSKLAVTKQDKCFLVEGYTDVISMFQSGIENVVASSGTSLTTEQIRLLKRFTRNVTVLYDGDEAGIKASIRGIDILLEEGMNVRVVLLPKDEDPDSYARNHSSVEFMKFIEENESDFITFKTRLLLKEAEKDPIRKSTLISEIVRSIAVIPESIPRSVYIRECSRMLDVDEKTLITETARIRRARLEQNTRQSGGYYEIPSFEPKGFPQLPAAVQEKYQAEKEVIRLLLVHGNQTFTLKAADNTLHEIAVKEYLLHEIENDELAFNHPVYYQIFNEFKEHYYKNDSLPEKHFIFHPDNAVSSTVVDLLTSHNYSLSKIWHKFENYVASEDMKLAEIVPEALMAFKIDRVLRMLKETENSLKTAQENHDSENIDALQNKYIILNSLKRELSKGLGERIII
ncbi:MAG: primase [Bacteroidetes bacterium]|nr:primase [Bacteroidota bacterium]MBS1234080.1 primase [Bacteroidota bacterium]